MHDARFVTKAPRRSSSLLHFLLLTAAIFKSWHFFGHGIFENNAGLGEPKNKYKGEQRDHDLSERELQYQKQALLEYLNIFIIMQTSLL